MLGFLAATNRWMSWSGGFNLLKANDEISYRAIASAFPSLPSQHLPEQHAERFPVHYLIGGLAQLLSVRLDLVYRVVALAVVIGILAMLVRILHRLDLSFPATVVCLAVFVLNAYALRIYWIAPAYLGDLVFVGFVAVALDGLLSGRYWLAFFALVGATCARQTAVPVALAAAGWIVWQGRGDRPARVAARAVGLLAAGVVTYTVLRIVAASFDFRDVPSISHFTILSSIERLPGTASHLAAHVARTLNGLLSVIAVSGALLLLRDPRERFHLPSEYWLCLLVALVIVAQPLVLSPSWVSNNETRLSVLALLPLTVSAAILMAEHERAYRAQFSWRLAAGLVALMALGSLHHVYTVVGTADKDQTVALQFLVALGIFLILSLPAPARGLTDGSARDRPL